MIVRHMKTGDDYIMLDKIIDSTNYRNGATVILYTRKNLCAKFLLFVMNLVGATMYVRDIEEFEEKFRRY